MTDRGRPPYEPSPKDRRILEATAGWAMPQERIARVIGIDAKTLRKHFAEELEIGSARLEAQLAQNLLRIAQGQDRQALIATIFALKSRLSYRSVIGQVSSGCWADTGFSVATAPMLPVSTRFWSIVTTESA